MSKSSKHNSNTSIDSFLKNVLNNTQDPKTFAPNLSRRSGNAGLDGAHMNNLLTNGKLVIPYNTSRGGRSGSEDENVSVTYSERNFNVVVSNHANNMDLNDHLVIKSIRQGLHIEELSSTSDSDAKYSDNKYSDMKHSDIHHSDMHHSDINHSNIHNGVNHCEANHIDSNHIDRETNTDDTDHNDIERQMCRSDCESKSSKRSRKRRTKSDNRYTTESSSCSELKQLAQSSLNSGASIIHEKNRDSKQSKTSIDVGCQANARDIVNQTSALDSDVMSKSHEFEKKLKTKRTKTKENKKFKESQFLDEEKKKKKDKYKSSGTSCELKCLKKHDNKYSDDSDVEDLIESKDSLFKAKIVKAKDIY